jgi:hypothetical protein
MFPIIPAILQPFFILLHTSPIEKAPISPDLFFFYALLCPLHRRIEHEHLNRLPHSDVLYPTLLS